MASPKNWKRWKSEETGDTVFMWKNTKKTGNSMVDQARTIAVGVHKKESGPGYRIDLIRSSAKSGQKIGESMNKEKARKKAVRWMRNHPNP